MKDHSKESPFQVSVVRYMEFGADRYNPMMDRGFDDRRKAVRFASELCQAKWKEDTFILVTQNQSTAPIFYKEAALLADRNAAYPDGKPPEEQWNIPIYRLNHVLVDNAAFRFRGMVMSVGKLRAKVCFGPYIRTFALQDVHFISNIGQPKPSTQSYTWMVSEQAWP